MSALIFLSAINLFLLGLSRRRGVREAFVMAFMGLFAAVTISTELLSIFGAITFRALTVVWTILAGTSTLLAWRLTDRALCRDTARAMRERIGTESLTARFSLASIAGILATTLTVALCAPPNTWDSMTYHMARVAAWIQQGSVQFYPTAIERQNYQLPLGGFAVLHLQLLSRSDIFANLPQWSCFVACIVLVTLVVKDFHQPLSVQVFGGLVLATLPEAILQASSTQTDLVCGAFCLAFAFFLARLAHGATRSNAVWCGVSLGLALLSKGTAYLYIGAIGLTIGTLYILRSRGQAFASIVRNVAWVALIALAINIGQWSRTCALYGRPLSGGTDSFVNEECSVSTVWANVVRNTALHLGVPQPAVNQATTEALTSLLGAQAANPKTTWPGTRFRVGFSTHEDTAGNPLHLALIVTALLGLYKARQVQRGTLLAWAGMVILGVLFFSAYLKWQPWHARLHTPLFVLAIPLVAVVGASVWRARSWAPTALACLLCVAALPFLLNNATRPLLPQRGFSILTHGRMKATLRSRPDLMAAYPKALEAALRDAPEEVGLMLGGDDWEYPLWVLSGKSAVRRLPVFRHIAVENASRELDLTRRLPDVVVSTRPLAASAIAEHGYTVAYRHGVVRVLRRKPSEP